MFQPVNVRATIDSLNANVAVLDDAGQLVQVNEGWRRFGARRNAASDYVGLNYLKVCADAAERGDTGAERVEKGLPPARRRGRYLRDRVSLRRADIPDERASG